MQKVDLKFLRSRRVELENQIAEERRRDAQQTIDLLMIELRVVDLAIEGTKTYKEPNFGGPMEYDCECGNPGCNSRN